MHPSDDYEGTPSGRQKTWLSYFGLTRRSLRVAMIVSAAWFAAVVAAYIWVCVARIEQASRMGFSMPFGTPSTLEAKVATIFLISVLLLPWCWFYVRQLLPALHPAWSLCLFAPVTCGMVCVIIGRSLPPSMYLLCGTTFAGLFLCTLAVLVVIRLIFYVLTTCKQINGRYEIVVSWLTISFIVVFTLCSSFSLPSVKVIDLHVPGLSPKADGYSLCMLADLHSGPLTRVDFLKAVVHRTKSLKCKMVLLNGDIAEGSVAQRADLMTELFPLREVPDGAYFVPGNHEFYNDQRGKDARDAAAEWNSWWESHGIQSLNNSHVLVPKSNQDKFIYLAGVDDILGRPNLSQALSGRDASNLPVVLVAHRPVHFAAAIRAKVDVQLSGHTHGGQLWPAQVLASRSSGGFLSGHYTVRGSQLYVSDGTISSYYTRLRLFSRAEITQVVFRSRPDVLRARWMREATLGLHLGWLALVLAACAALVFTCKLIIHSVAMCKSVDMEDGPPLSLEVGICQR